MQGIGPAPDTGDYGDAGSDTLGNVARAVGGLRLPNLERLGPKDAVKFVVCSEDDYRWSRRIIDEKGLAGKCHLLLSPSFGQVEPKDLVSWMLRDRVPARLNLQIHKYVWPPEQRGV